MSNDERVFKNSVWLQNGAGERHSRATGKRWEFLVKTVMRAAPVSASHRRPKDGQGVPKKNNETIKIK